MRRQIEGGRFAPYQKTAGTSRSQGDKKHQSEGATIINTISKGSSTLTSLKAIMKMGKLLSPGNKISGQPPAIHPPWNKARIEPMENKNGGGESLKERKGEKVEKGFERREVEKKEKQRGRDEETEKWARGEMETWRESNKGGGTNNGMRNTVGGGEGIRPEQRGVLPGLPSSDRNYSLYDGMVIDGIYFQTCAEPRKPPLVKQRLKEAPSLISLARRLQGTSGVGDMRWSNGRSWDRGEENSREIYGSIGEMSVSASVSGRGTGNERKRWELEVEDGSWKRREKNPNIDTRAKSGSKESQYEFSLSDASSITSSVTAEHEYDTETEKTVSGTEEEEGVSDTEESGSQDDGGEGSDSEMESGLESEDEGTESSRKYSKSSVRNSSVSQRRRGGDSLQRESRRQQRFSRSTNSSGRSSSSDSNCSRYSGSSGSRPKTSLHSRSSHKTIEEESENEEESEDEEAGKIGGTSSQSDVGSGVIDPSDNLSTIIEDAEEEESGEGEEEDKMGGGLENESAA